MKTNYSAAEISKWLSSLVLRGWTVEETDGMKTYSSPVTQIGTWIVIVNSGRAIRTITSYGGKYEGLMDAQIAVKNCQL